MKNLKWLGHGCWLLECEACTLIVDPYLRDDRLVDEIAVDFVLVSHGHGDHTAHAAAIAKRTGATIVAIPEICDWFEKKGIKKTIQMNIGGTVPIPGGRILMTPAFHSSTMPDGANGGVPCGFVVSLGNALEGAIEPISEAMKKNFNVYFACDTGLFAEMEWLGKGGIDAAILPIGDLFTMGPHASLDAIRLLKPKLVFPSHYGTWPPIDQYPVTWAEAVKKHTDSMPILLKYCEKYEL